MNTSTSKTVTTIPKGSTGNMSLTAQVEYGSLYYQL